jgi:protein SCO1/2
VISRKVPVRAGIRVDVQRMSALTLCCILLAAVQIGCGAAAAHRQHADASHPVRYAAPGQAIPRKPAPGFALRDQDGKRVRLAQFRGKAVMLTFIYDHCPDVCPLIVGDLHAALQQLGPDASKVQMLAVSVDPVGDTPKTVKRFLAAHDMTGRMEYLIGSERQLAPVWRRYGIDVQASPDRREVSGHSALVYGISATGEVTTFYPSNMSPAWVAHDVPLLAAR